MIKYRIVSKKIIADTMDLEEALTSIDTLRSSNPGVDYDIEDYVWKSPSNIRLGRDPDLH